MKHPGDTFAPSERLLSWPQLASSVVRLLRLSFRVTFQRKLLFMFVGIVIYYALLYTVAVFEPNAGFAVDGALILFVELPGTAVAIYLTMDLVSKERDRQTLETLYSTATSHYMIWIVRLASVAAVLLGVLLAMSTASYFLFAELPYVRGALNGFVPAAVMMGMAFYVASWAKGANTAAMISAAVFLFVLMLTEDLEGSAYWIFLNPFGDPVGGTDLFWTDRIVVNRVGYLTLAAFLVFLALRRMEKRERFLS